MIQAPWRQCCGECGSEQLHHADGHADTCGRCGAAWDGSEVVAYPCGRGRGSSNWRWRMLDLELRLGVRPTARPEYEEWLAMVASG